MDTIKSRFEKKDLPYNINEANQAPTSKRILAYIIDLGLTVLTAMLLSTFAFEPALNFSSKQAEVTQKQDKVEEIGISTHLYLSINDELLTNSELSKNYLLHETKNITTENYVSPIEYFYTEYLDNDYIYLNQQIYGLPTSTNLPNSNLYFTYDLSKSNPLTEPAILKDDVLNSLKEYIDLSITSTNETLYTNFIAFYSSLLSDAQQKLFSDQSGEYSLAIGEYNANYQSLLWISSNSAFISYSISFVIFFIIVPTFIKNGKTIGKLLFKIHLVNQDNTKLDKWSVLSRGTILTLSSFMGIAFVPFLSWTIYSFFLPFAIIGETTLPMFVPAFVSFAIACTSLFTIAASKTHQSPQDFVAKTAVIVDNEIEESTLGDKELLSIDIDKIKR